MDWLSEDQERLKRFRQGDRQTLHEVYTHYAPILGRFLVCGFSFTSQGRHVHFRGMSSPFDLDDLVQDTFMRVFAESARMSYDGVQPYIRYLKTTAKNLLIDSYRLQKRKSAVFVEVSDDIAEGQHQDCTAQDPELEAQESQLKKIYQDFKDSLDPRSQTVWLMRFEKKQTRQKTQEITGLSSMQLRTLEVKLKKKLLKKLKKSGYSLASMGDCWLIWLLFIVSTQRPFFYN
jgi:RNA polymerase sigma factor (sigma-70 family)